MKNIIQSFVLITGLLLGLNFNLCAQAYTWGTTFGSMYNDNITAMVTDASGNVYLTGTYNGSITIGTTTIGSSGLLDVYIAKYTSAGALVWLRSIGGSSNDYANDIAVDGVGNVTIVGSFQASVDFNPSATATFMLSTAVFNYTDGFVLRLNSSGNFVWAKSFVSDNYCAANGLALDAAGNIYVGGDFYGQMDANPSAANVMLTTVGQNDGFLIKLSSAGIYLWNKTYTTGIADEVTEVAVDAGGNVIVGGRMSYVPFMAKYSGAGVASWSKNLEGGAGLFINDIATDAWGNIFMGGSYSDSLDIDLNSGRNMWYEAGTGDYNMFIIKLNASGNTLWGQQTLSYSGGGTNDEYLDALAVDAAGSVYAIGTTEGLGCMPVNVTTFNNLSSQVKSVYGGQGNSNLFVLKYGKDGSYGSGFEWYFPVLNAIGKIAVDGSGNIYATGTFNTYSSLDPANVNIIYSTGSDDCFLTKFAPPCAFANAGSNMYLCPNVQGATPASTGSVKLGVETIGGMLYEWSPSNGLSDAYIAQPLASPPTTTTYNLTVTNALTGCTSTSSVTVTPPITPIPANQLGADKIGCPNNYINVGSPIMNLANFQFVYSSNSGDITFTTNNMAAGYLETHATIAGTYQIYAEITEITTGCVVRDTVNVTFQNPKPNAGTDFSMCQGVSATLGGTAVAGLSYNWTGTYSNSSVYGVLCSPTMLNNPNIANPAFSPIYGLSAYQYIVSGTDNYGCTGFDTVQISVYANNFADAGVDKTKCGTTGVTIGTIPVNNYYMIQWTPATGLSATNIDQPIANPTVNTTYVLTKTLTYNNVTCIDKDTVIVTVGTIPTANAGADQSICKGAAVTIGGTSSVGMNYAWSPNLATTATTSVSPTATTNYTLTVTNPTTGCKKSDDVRITVKSLPIVNAGADATLCAGANTLIGANAITGQTYAWTPSTGLNSATTSKPTATPTATTTYIVTATKNACTKKDTVVVTVNALPTANAGVDKSICSGTSTTIGATNNVANVYEWTPATNLSNPFISNPVATPTAATTTYTVNVTNTTTGCTNTDAVLVTVNAKPVANAGVDKNLTNCTAVSIGSAAVTGVSYSWTPATGLSSTTISNPTASPAGMALNATRTYTVTASKVYGTLTCSSTDAMLFKAMVACPSAPDQVIDNGQTEIGTQNQVNMIVNSEDVTIYPNPFTDEINISSATIISGNYHVMIVNTLGQLVYDNQFQVKETAFHHKIDMSKYSAGFYFLTFESEMGKVVKKLVKE